MNRKVFTFLNKWAKTRHLWQRKWGCQPVWHIVSASLTICPAGLFSSFYICEHRMLFSKLQAIWYHHARDKGCHDCECERKTSHSEQCFSCVFACTCCVAQIWEQFHNIKKYRYLKKVQFTPHIFYFKDNSLTQVHTDSHWCLVWMDIYVWVHHGDFLVSSITVINVELKTKHFSEIWEMYWRCWHATKRRERERKKQKDGESNYKMHNATSWPLILQPFHLREFFVTLDKKQLVPRHFPKNIFSFSIRSDSDDWSHHGVSDSQIVSYKRKKAC